LGNPFRKKALLALVAGLLLAAPAAFVVAGHRPSVPARAGQGAQPAQPTGPVGGKIVQPASPGPASPSAPPKANQPPPPVAGTLPDFSHVFVIVMENREYGTIIGNPAAPYTNSLARSYALATNYFAVSHPSLPNYLALAAGDTFGITSDCTACFVNAPNIADQVEASGRSWRAYMEGMPSACFLGASGGGYAQKHNPFVYFTNIRNDPARCAAHVVPFTAFSTDLAGGSVPNYVWITPNMCNDMHDCATSVGDSWLANIVPQILASAAWRDGGVLFITWDEGSSSAGWMDSWGGRVATLVISPYGRNGYQSSVLESHDNLLRTIEDAWHLGALGHAASHPAMREVFR
jgi:acid phosphatase